MRQTRDLKYNFLFIIFFKIIIMCHFNNFLTTKPLNFLSSRTLQPQRQAVPAAPPPLRPNPPHIRLQRGTRRAPKP